MTPKNNLSSKQPKVAPASKQALSNKITLKKCIQCHNPEFIDPYYTTLRAHLNHITKNNHGDALSNFEMSLKKAMKKSDDKTWGKLASIFQKLITDKKTTLRAKRYSLNIAKKMSEREKIKLSDLANLHLQKKLLQTVSPNLLVFLSAQGQKQAQKYLHHLRQPARDYTANDAITQNRAFLLWNQFRNKLPKGHPLDITLTQVVLRNSLKTDPAPMPATNTT